MSKKKNFFEVMVGETPVAPDFFWGLLAMTVYIVAETLFEIINWPWWFILAGGMNSLLFIIEAMRFRVPLAPKYRSAQRVALVCIFVFLFGSIVAFLQNKFFKG